MNVSLTPELERFVRAKVDSGLYNSASEVVREALRLLVARAEEETARQARRAEADWAEEVPGYLERSPERLEKLRGHRD